MADEKTILPDGASSPSINDQFKKRGIAAPVTPAANPPAKVEATVKEPENKIDETVIDWQAKAKALEAEVENLTNNPKIVTIEKILSPEDIQAKADAERKEFLNYVVIDKKIPAMDLERYEINKNLTARDYLFEKYKSEVIADDPDTAPNELLIAFESEYGLGTTDEKALRRANQKMEIEANAKKAEEFKIFHGLNDEFKNVQSVKAKAKDYSQLVADAKPEIIFSIQPDGFDEPVQVIVDYTDIDASLRKELLTTDAFQSFTKDGVDTAKSIGEFIQDFVEKKKMNKIIEEAVDKLVQKKISQLKIGAIAPADTPGGSNVQQVNKFEYTGIQKQIDANK